jgi:hypothetical protein
MARFDIAEIEGRVGAVRTAAPLLAALTDRDPAAAARLISKVSMMLNLPLLTVHEEVFPTTIGDAASEARDTESCPDPPPTKPIVNAVANSDASDRDSVRRFPDPDVVGHYYAHHSPAGSKAVTFVHHEPANGHTAWVIAEGITTDAEDRAAATLAAEIAGMSAVLVGARCAIELARTALNRQYADRTARQGNATIVVVTTAADSPGRFAIAWAGDTRVYAIDSVRGCAIALTTDHIAQAGSGLLSASVRVGTIGINYVHQPPPMLVLASRALSVIPANHAAQAFAERNADTVALTALTSTPCNVIVIRPGDGPSRHFSAVQIARLDAAHLDAMPNEAGAYRYVRTGHGPIRTRTAEHPVHSAPGPWTR